MNAGLLACAGSVVACIYTFVESAEIQYFRSVGQYTPRLRQLYSSTLQA
ncbi:hypothetical protein ABID39_001023 [Bartonella japonica]|uniref:Uncharacterized protein n=1 Tax=Bartonella japonica TaxID=357761 RepID=A0ABV2FP43_9HYPH